MRKLQQVLLLLIVLSFGILPLNYGEWLSPRNMIYSNTVTSKESSSRTKALPPVHLNSSWIGNQWIPPSGYRLYSPSEMLDYFRGKNILVVGDSTGRRTFMTFIDLLKTANDRPNDVLVEDIDSPSRLDLNKGIITQACDTEGHQTCVSLPYNISASLIRHACLFSIKNDITNRQSPLRKALATFDIIIFILGPWEVLEKFECGAHKVGRLNSTNDFFQTLFALESEANQPESTITNMPNMIWRTWGAPGATFRTLEAAEKCWGNARVHNQYVTQLLDAHDVDHFRNTHSISSLSYIDWGAAMAPRMLPESQRIKGDIDAHYGLEARLTFLQMMMNHLVERDRLRWDQIPPYATTLYMNESTLLNEFNVPNDFLSLTPVVTLTAEESTRLSELQGQFCGDCVWNAGILCASRKDYMQSRYRLGELEALGSVLQAESCRLAINPVNGTKQ